MKSKFWVIWKKDAKSSSSGGLINKEEAEEEAINRARQTGETYYLLESICIYKPLITQVPVEKTII